MEIFLFKLSEIYIKKFFFAKKILRFCYLMYSKQENEERNNLTIKKKSALCAGFRGKSTTVLRVLAGINY